MAKHWSQVDVSRLMFVSIKITCIVDNNTTRDICTLVHIIDQVKAGSSATYETNLTQGYSFCWSGAPHVRVSGNK